jgi:hypothetical protein
MVLREYWSIGVNPRDYETFILYLNRLTIFIGIISNNKTSYSLVNSYTTDNM